MSNLTANVKVVNRLGNINLDRAGNRILHHRLIRGRSIHYAILVNSRHLRPFSIRCFSRNVSWLQDNPQLAQSHYSLPNFRISLCKLIIDTLNKFKNRGNAYNQDNPRYLYNGWCWILFPVLSRLLYPKLLIDFHTL